MIINIGVFFIRIINRLVPNWTLPEEATTALSYFGVYVKKMDWAFPVSDLFTIIGMVLAFEITVFLFRFVLGFINMVRGSGKLDI